MPARRSTPPARSTRSRSPSHPPARTDGGAARDARAALQHVVLRGGIAYERMVLAWLDDV
ncbi:hypothetical protein ABZV78_25240, partial [Micromonospora sp. NPDC004540]